MIAVQPKSRRLLGINQQAYQTLRSALRLNLRRQLLIAVCDSVALQEQLATQLEGDSMFNSKASFEGTGFDSFGAITTKPGANTIGRLKFEPNDAHLPRQVARRMSQIEQSGRQLSQLQVLGIEQMTRQPAITQNYFLRSLNTIDTLLPKLETSLLIWVSWPWLRTMQASAPEFWQWRNGVYEFVSDPTPTPAYSNYPSKTEKTEILTAQQADTLQLIDSQAEGSLATADSFFANRNEQSTQIIARLHGETDDCEEIEAGTATNVATGFVAGSIAGASVDVLSSNPQSISSQADSDSSTNKSDWLNWQKRADEHFSVGYQHRRLIESGDHTLATIESAIAAYEAGLQCLESQGALTDGMREDAEGERFGLASCLNDLGTLYWLKAQQLSDPQRIADCMVYSTQFYSQALEQQDPTMAGQIYSNVGAVYSLLASYRYPVFCLQQAIAAYNQAITLGSHAHTPREQATLYNSLGSSYWKLSHHDQTDQHLRLAIRAYQAALQSYDSGARDLDYAAVQNNLGIACWSLAKRESSIALYEQAITAYQAALVYRTCESDPAACAVTYNNLALAYWDLSKEDIVERTEKTIYQRNAIAAFNAALKTAKDRSILSDTDTATIYHCLGDVYMQMVEVTPEDEPEDEIADALQKALHSYIQSIGCLTEASPLFQPILAVILRNLRFHYKYGGLAGQQNALNQLPSRLIPYMMPAL
ncbi:hypothetical protein S7335_4884 [Synechococcus sp. PCC 7335]|uniref:tetratricopeptide repeat protein n=1 Tax=Synechococcus sp. (strain ATCC 29403 / PCC 7335) TaxID=91464 RepID=UPI00017EC74D|nr:tetratricopeptide repeat protein [Synechococcus sp. PCC 7335]EDX87177.1 hypothetical protein S7335_4884 [Synechococcus sp. PCC 7335]